MQNQNSQVDYYQFKQMKQMNHLIMSSFNIL